MIQSDVTSVSKPEP